MSETPETTPAQTPATEAAPATPAETTPAATTTQTTPATQAETPADRHEAAKAERPGPAYGLGSEPVKGDGPDEDPQKFELDGKDFSDLPSETRAELHRNAGRVLSTDSAGVDRVVTQHATDWEPAPIDPDPAVVEHTARVEEALEAAQQDRVNRLGLQQDAAAEAADKVSTREG